MDLKEYLSTLKCDFEPTEPWANDPRVGGFISGKELLPLLMNKEYDFLRTDKRFRVPFIVAFRGSNAKGYNHPKIDGVCEESDVDFSMVFMDNPSSLLRGGDLANRTMTKEENWSSFADTNTDTLIYSFTHFIDLCLRSDPSALDLLHMDDSQYIYISPYAKILKKHADEWFISKETIRKQIGFGLAQFRRFDNFTARNANDLKTFYKHIIECANHHFDEHWAWSLIQLNSEDIRNSNEMPFVDFSAKAKEDNGEPLYTWTLGNMTYEQAKKASHEFLNYHYEFIKEDKRLKHARHRDKMDKHLGTEAEAFINASDLLLNNTYTTNKRRHPLYHFIMGIRNGSLLGVNKSSLRKEDEEKFKTLENLINEELKKSNLREKNDYVKSMEYVEIVIKNFITYPDVFHKCAKEDWEKMIGIK